MISFAKSRLTDAKFLSLTRDWCNWIWEHNCLQVWIILVLSYRNILLFRMKILIFAVVQLKRQRLLLDLSLRLLENDFSIDVSGRSSESNLTFFKVVFLKKIFSLFTTRKNPFLMSSRGILCCRILAPSCVLFWNLKFTLNPLQILILQFSIPLCLRFDRLLFFCCRSYFLTEFVFFEMLLLPSISSDTD
jgi:hypothetical protein